MKQNKFVLDAYAILAFLQKDPGYGRVESILRSAMTGEASVYISAINLAEVQYHVLRTGRDASKILAALEALPLQVAPVDAYLSQVVELRAKYQAAFGTCFAAALAQDMKRPIITADRQFRKLETAVAVEWLR